MDPPVAVQHVDEIDVEPAASPAPTDKRLVLASWIALLMSVISFSAIGPMFKWMMVKWNLPTGLTVCWRNQVMVLFFIIPTIVEYHKTPSLERSKWWTTLPVDTMPATSDVSVTWTCCRPAARARPFHISVFMAALIAVWVGNIWFWVESLKLTTVVRASLFSCTFPLMIMAYVRLRLGVRHSLGEFIGVLCAFAGIGLALIGEVSGEQSTTNPLGLLGDFMSLLSAVLLAAWIVLGQHIRGVLPIFIYTCTSTSLHGLTLAIYSVLFEGTTVWYTAANPNHSLIGWLHPDFVWQMVGFGFVIGTVGFLAYNWCIKYIDPVIFSTVQLLDPAFTALISWAAGLEGVPDVWTIIGGCVVIGGIVLMVVYENQRTQREQRELEQRQPVPSTELEIGPQPDSLESDFDDFRKDNFD